jgi:holo-[acyl-carrier protein] synthase
MGLRLGCDLCQIAAVTQILEAGGAALARLFSDAERSYALEQKRPEQHLAGTYAAKEALAKAIREPSLLGNYYREVTVQHSESGAPSLHLSNILGEVFARQRIEVLDVSISHDADYAMAAVLVQFADAPAEHPKRAQCYRCLITLDHLVEQRIADMLFTVRSADGAMRYLCPACARGW